MANEIKDTHKPLHRMWFRNQQGNNEGNTDEDPSPAEFKQVYGSVADLYHKFRPRYSEWLIDEAIAKSPSLAGKNPKDLRILELGCGPGTLTLPLTKRGFNITAVEPGEGMVDKAREICKDYDNAVFRQESFEDFSANGQTYDAIVAASSIHWALSDDKDGELYAKLHSLLKPNGSLLLFWNFPPEPKDLTLEKVAEVVDEAKPFYFSGGSVANHRERLHEKILKPLEESTFFSKFENVEESFNEETSIPDYLNFLNTLSNYIIMGDDKRQAFFDMVAEVLAEEHGALLPTYRESLLNVALRQDI